VRMSLVLAGLRVQHEATAADGSTTLTARKPGGTDDEVEEDSSDEDES